MLVFVKYEAHSGFGRSTSGGCSSGGALGLVEFAVLESVSRGAHRSRRTAQQIRVLRGTRAGRQSCTTFCGAARGAGCSAAPEIARVDGTS